MDIGGSLAKIAYYSTIPVRRSVVYPAEDSSSNHHNSGRYNDTINC